MATTPLAVAQSAVGGQERHNFETRAALESQINAAEAKGDKSEAGLIQYRLDHGDFHEGDRIVVKVQGAAGFTDTLIVRSGKLLQLPRMPDLSLDAVLRSELTSRLTTYIGGYLRDPIVQATPLVRVGILGSVGHPGYYYAPADLPLNDVLMFAGGPTAAADLAKVSVRRKGQIIINESNSRTALSEGMSLDRLNLQAGDEISVGEQRRFNWAVIIPTVTGILGLLVAFTQIHR
ncbi:MAG: SLBB domain-containing protein [Gemmatimonadota bacterium]|nr:SLBB domain-containing protein [Gemmatimonadota bacterium]